MIKIILSRSFLLLLFVFVSSSCRTVDPKVTHDCCKILSKRKHWYKYAKQSYAKWGVPIYIQLAIIKQESSFQKHAKPKRKKLLGIIPWKRPYSAYGYAQALDQTWDWYKKKTGESEAERNNFKDATDFIGWYSYMSNDLIGIKHNDAYNLYLAYHEGHGGFLRKSYQKKSWLKKIAKKVYRQAHIYKKQLKTCEKSLNRKKFLGLF